MNSKKVIVAFWGSKSLGRREEVAFAQRSPSRIHLVHHLADVLRHLNYLFPGDGDPIHLNPFREIDQVGRGIEANPVAGLAQNESQEGCRRALPVGAGNMNRPQPHMGIPQMFQEGGNIVQAQFDAKSLQPEKIAEGIPVVFFFGPFSFPLSTPDSPVFSPWAAWPESVLKPSSSPSAQQSYRSCRVPKDTRTAGTPRVTSA